jgi:hypothetical protein
VSAVRQATRRLSLRAGFLEKREKWRNPRVDVYYLVPVPPSPLGNGIMGLAGIFCFGL